MSCDAHGAVLQGSSHRQSRAPRRPDTLESRTEQVNEQATHTSGTAAWALHARAQCAWQPGQPQASGPRGSAYAPAPCRTPCAAPAEGCQWRARQSCLCRWGSASRRWLRLLLVTVTSQSGEIRCRLRCAPQSAASPQSVVARQLYAPLVAQHLGGQRWSAGGVQRRRRSIDTATSPPPCP